MELIVFEVTEENYHLFLTYHGHDIEVARNVVNQYDNTDGYKSLGSVRLWVDASKMVIKLHEKNRLEQSNT